MFSPDAALSRGKCTSCGLCSSVCPTGAAGRVEGAPPAFDLRSCIHCGHCASVCPVDAFGLGTPWASPSVTAAQVRELAASRRSVRRFLDRDITAEEIASVLSIVGQSPTGTNACGLRVVAVHGRERVDSELVQPLRRMLRFWWNAGPLRLAGLAGGTGRYLKGILDGEDLVFRGAPAVLFFFAPASNPTRRADAVIAATLVMIEAQASGLGTLWNGVAEVLYSLVRRWRFHGLRGYRLGAVLCVGHPGLKYRPLPDREWDHVGI